MKNNRPDISLIRKYLNGELDARAMYELERLAQDDPALMDVMMGMEMGNIAEDEANLSAIDQLIQKRVEGDQVKRLFPWKTWAAAASFIIGISVIAVLMLQRPERTLLTDASSGVKQKDKTITPNKELPPKKASAVNGKSPVTNTTAAVLKPGFSRHRPGPADISAEILNPSSPAQKIPVKITAEADPVALASLRRNTDSVINARNSLREVAIIGYGVQRKRDFTAASAIIKAEPAETEKSLSGKIAGLMINPQDKQAEGKAAYIVKGIVTDEMNIPMPGVSVKLAKGQKGTSTDINGKFSIEVPSKEEALQIATIGYNSKVVKAEGSNTLNISLKPDNAALSEVVVVGYGTAKKRAAEIIKAQPASGWEAYHEYLKANATVSDGKAGRVTLAFTIGADGTPVNVRVVKSAGDAIDQKAIQLVMNGPKWIGDRNELTREIILKIRFRKH